jgi:hypothetical protein
MNDHYHYFPVVLKGCRAMKYNLYRKNVQKYSYEHAVKVRRWVPPGPGSRGGHLHGSDPRPRSRGGGGPPHHQVGATRVRRHRRGILTRRAGLPSPPAPVEFHRNVLSPNFVICECFRDKPNFCEHPLHNIQRSLWKV